MTTESPVYEREIIEQDIREHLAAQLRGSSTEMLQKPQDFDSFLDMAWQHAAPVRPETDDFESPFLAEDMQALYSYFQRGLRESGSHPHRGLAYRMLCNATADLLQERYGLTVQNIAPPKIQAADEDEPEIDDEQPPVDAATAEDKAMATTSESAASKPAAARPAAKARKSSPGAALHGSPFSLYNDRTLAEALGVSPMSSSFKQLWKDLTAPENMTQGLNGRATSNLGEGEIRLRTYSVKGGSEKWGVTLDSLPAVQAYFSTQKQAPAEPAATPSPEPQAEAPAPKAARAPRRPRPQPAPAPAPKADSTAFEAAWKAVADFSTAAKLDNEDALRGAIAPTAAAALALTPEAFAEKLETTRQLSHWQGVAKKASPHLDALATAYSDYQQQRNAAGRNVA